MTKSKAEQEATKKRVLEKKKEKWDMLRQGMEAQKKLVGRQYHPNLGPHVYDLMAVDGMFTKTQVASHLGIAKSTLDVWLNKYPEFKEHFTLGKEAAQANMEKLGLQGVMQRPADFNNGQYQFIMKTQFKEDWQDTQKQEINFNDMSNMTQEEIANQIKLLNKPKEMVTITQQPDDNIEDTGEDSDG